MNAPPSTPRLHQVPVAMERLSVGRTRIYELIESGELRSVKVGRRRLIPEAAIVEYIDRLIATQCPDLGESKVPA